MIEYVHIYEGHYIRVYSIHYISVYTRKGMGIAMILMIYESNFEL